WSCATRKRSNISQRVNLANIIDSQLGDIEHAAGIQRQTDRLNQYCLSAGSIQRRAAGCASGDGAYAAVCQIYPSYSIVVRIGNKQEVAVVGKHQRRRSVESRAVCLTVRETRDAVTSDGFYNGAAGSQRYSSDRMVAGVGNVNRSVGRNDHLIRRSEGRIELTCISVAGDALTSAVKDLLLFRIVDFPEQTGHGVHCDACSG